MEKRELIGTTVLHTQEKGEYTLHYYLTTRQLSSNEAVYGICVEKIESIASSGITSDEKQARKFAAKLIKQKISPMCLFEVLDDLYPYA